MKTFADTKNRKRITEENSIEIKLQMKNLEFQTKKSEVNITNRLQAMK